MSEQYDIIADGAYAGDESEEAPHWDGIRDQVRHHLHLDCIVPPHELVVKVRPGQSADELGLPKRDKTHFPFPWGDVDYNLYPSVEDRDGETCVVVQLSFDDGPFPPLSQRRHNPSMGVKQAER